MDLFLNNGQHALLEVNPMKDSHVTNGGIPEMIVFASCREKEWLSRDARRGGFPGLRAANVRGATCKCRWL